MIFLKNIFEKLVNLILQPKIKSSIYAYYWTALTQNIPKHLRAVDASWQNIPEIGPAALYHLWLWWLLVYNPLKAFWSMNFILPKYLKIVGYMFQILPDVWVCLDYWSMIHQLLQRYIYGSNKRGWWSVWMLGPELHLHFNSPGLGLQRKVTVI